MNILFRAAKSVNGSQKKILDKLDDSKVFDRCVIIDDSDGKDLYDEAKYIVIPATIVYSTKFDYIMSMNDLVEPEPYIYMGLEKYKALCMKLISLRYCGIQFGSFSRLEMEYERHVKFIYNLLVSNKIEFVYFSIMPHVVFDYVLYSMAIVMNIPLLTSMQMSIQGLSCVGTRIENVGKNVVIENKNGNDLVVEEIKPIIERYINSASKAKSFTGEREKRRQAYVQKYNAWCQVSLKRCIGILKKKLFHQDVTPREECALEARKEFGIQRGVGYYNRKASKVIPKGEYVYFALQLTPEATTLPWAGIFENQLYTIRILAEVCQKYGIKIVVKEHWIQPYRSKLFYDSLARIPNVYCIDSRIDSYELISGCFASATQTGSCISESIVKGKPVICFADGFWSGADNVFSIKAKKDIDNAIKTIRNTIFNYKDIQNKYFAAISRTCIRFKVDYEADFISDEDVANDVYDFIKGFIDSGMIEDYLYRRN